MGKVSNVKKILCSISTKGRYHTFLPLAIQSVINQTRKPDWLIIYDDNDEPEDMREFPVYQQLFKLLDLKQIRWEWVFAKKKGQHYNHQDANERAVREGYDFVWRVDDDNSAESTVLENLEKQITKDKKIGAVGGAILTPNWDTTPRVATGKIRDIDNESNIQWGYINNIKQVEHLHCSFLYRAGVYDYNLALTKVAHREETLFTYGMHKLGYKLFVIPNTVTWHFKSETGGIRSTNKQELYEHDEKIFRNFVGLEDKTIVILDSGMGDHIVFKHVLPHLTNPDIYSCYPEIVPGKSIQEAKERFGDIDHWNIYKKMDEWKWNKSLELAFRKMYGVDK
jgi:hypothetical protein